MYPTVSTRSRILVSLSIVLGFVWSLYVSLRPLYNDPSYSLQFCSWLFWVVGTGVTYIYYSNNIKHYFEPKSGFKITKAWVRKYYHIYIRDYLEADDYQFESGTKPTEQEVINFVLGERQKNREALDRAESFKREFEGRVFTECEDGCHK